MNNTGNFSPQVDAAAMQALARQATTASRSGLAQSVVVLFDAPEASLSPQARAMAYDILHMIVRDIEKSARQDISRRLAERDDAPHDLIRFLAGDAIEVAFPVLVKSGVLDDADLLEIIRACTKEHSLAIAARPNVSPSIADALIMTDAEDVIVAVLKNQGSEIAPGTMVRLVEKAQKVQAIREPLVVRREMNPELALRLFLLVSTALREYILQHFKFDRDAVNQLCDQIMLDEIEHFANDGLNKGELSKRISAMIKNKGKLTPEMLILALREGEVNTFVTLFARMTDLKHHMIDRLLFDPTGKGLAIACKSLGAGKIAFVSLFTLGQKIRAEVTGTIKLRLRDAIDFYNALPKKDATEVLNEWRRGADYVGSVRVLTHRMKSLQH